MGNKHLVKFWPKIKAQETSFFLISLSKEGKSYRLLCSKTNQWFSLFRLSLTRNSKHNGTVCYLTTEKKTITQDRGECGKVSNTP